MKRVGLTSLALLLLFGCEREWHKPPPRVGGTSAGPAYYGTFYGPLNSTGTNGGYINLNPPSGGGTPGGITNAGIYTSTNRVYSMGYERYVNTWAGGPTGVFDLNLGAQTYTAFTPVSVTGLVNSTTNSQMNAMLLVTNASSSNITFYGPPGVVELSGQSSLILTNQSVGAFSFSSYGNFAIATYSGGRSNTVSTAMYPTNIPGAGMPTMWLNGDISTYVNGTSAYWTDASGNNNGVTNMASSFHPTKVTNAIGTNTALSFANQYLTNLVINIPQPFTVAVTLLQSTNTYSGQWYGGTNAPSPYVGANANFGQFNANAGGTAATFGSYVMTNKFATYVLTYNGASSTGWTNGVQAGTTHSIGTLALVGMGLGGTAFEASLATCTIYDLAVYPVAFTTAMASNYNCSITNSRSLNVPLVQP